MTKAEMKSLVKDSISKRNLCRMFFKYHKNYWYYFPVKVSNHLLMGTEEEDFILNGYSIRRFVDLRKVELKKDKCIEILKREGIIEGIHTPEIDITNWETVFHSLNTLDKNIIVERESLDEDEEEFVIGRIDKVYKRFVDVYHFDADGIWLEEPFRIPYTQITSVSFGTRYVDIFSKYIGEPPK